MNLQDFRRSYAAAFEEALLEEFPEQDATSIHPSIRYSLTNGGKRLRPFFILALVQAFGGDPKSAFSLAKAIEYIHCYSLIHDDLPAMDDDDYRRGKPSNHKAFDEATAILAGDALQAKAFEVISQDTDLAAESRISLLAQLAKAAGDQGMVAGQMKDIIYEGQKVSLAQLKALYDQKTGALIRFSLQAPLGLVQVSDQTKLEMASFAQAYALAFQIQNDLQEVLWTDEERGKHTHSDQELEKNTYPALLGLEAAQEALRGEIKRCEEILSRLEEVMDTTLIRDFLDYLKV
ncbi:polyprenyl synthetase family protein [Aerococcus sanguinicola]